MPQRIQMSRQRPWRADNPDAVIVSRPSKWGNPFTVEEFGARRAVDKYLYWIEGRVRDGHLDLAELRGRDLACWCPLNPGWVDGFRDDEPIDRCHADVLLRLANVEG